MQSSILETRLVHWADEAGCAASAESLAARPGLGDAFIELHGPLGAGKTTFARHLLHALGVVGAIKSPTYALMEPYVAAGSRGGFAIAHFDFYRFDDPDEWEDAGFREVFADSGLKLGHIALVAPDLERALPAHYARTFADVGRGELLLYEDAARRLSVAVSHGDAAVRLGVTVDDQLRIRPQ